MKNQTHSLFKRSIAFLCIIIVVALFASAISGYYYNVAQIERSSATNAKAGATAAAEVIEEENFDDICQSQTGQTYIKVRRILKSICQSFDLEYLYLYVPDYQSSTINYIMTVATDEEKDKIVEAERGLNVTISADISSQEQSAWNGDYDYSVYEENNSYGHVYSWFYAVKNAEGEAIALIGCDYRIDSLTAQVIEETLLILLPMCIALLFIVVLLIAFMNKKVFAPIKIISSRMNSFIDERKQDFKPLNINSGDEIQGIANSFEKMSKDINNYIETNQKLITESVQAKVQMDVANRIQCGIVPSQLSIEGDNYSVFGYAKPAKEVGGDFYDCFTLPDGRVCIFIGDVSGKGIGAALFMVMVKTMLKDYLNSNLSPAKALNMVNDTLCNSNPEGMFATVFVAVFNAQSRQLTFANAGHTRPVMLGSTPKFLAVDSGVAIGLFEDIGICDNCITLSDGGLLLYTDGVTEANNSQKQFFGDKALLSATQGGNSAKGVIEQLNGRVNNFVGQNEQFDDYTAIALWLKEAAVKKFTFEREAASWQKLQQIILSYNSQNLNKKAVCLACEEAFINIVNYSKATFIEVGLGEEGDIFKVTFKDNGIRFNPLDEREQKSFEEYDGGGMGIGIIKNLADAHYSYEDNYNVLTLNFLKK